MIRATIFAATLLVLLAGCQPKPQTQGMIDGHPDLRGEVQSFYDWYLADSGMGRNIDDVLATERDHLSPELAALLDADRKCAEESHSICNIDSDPFTNSQDPCQRYEVGPPIADSATVRFNVYAVCSGERDEVPDLQATVIQRDSVWAFVNLTYGMEGTDLLTLLRRPVVQ